MKSDPRDYVTHNSYLEVNTDTLRSNVAAAAAESGAMVIPVLKCDAYGLGMTETAKALEPMAQVKLFAVAHISEGTALREAGIRKEILVLGNPMPHLLRAAADAGLTLTAGRLGLIPVLAKLPGNVKIQIKIDSGLHRVGVEPGEELAALLAELKAAENLILTGVYSHFGNTADADRCAGQAAVYEAALRQIEAAGFSVPLRHISDSAASENYPEYRFDAVRLGRRLFMDRPGEKKGSIRECASWRTWITGIHERTLGESLGYADACVLKRNTRVALIGIGYGDGLPEELVKAHGSVLIRGKRCPMLACCMDQTFVDVTDAEAEIGDEVTLFGYNREGTERILSQEQAEAYGGNEGCAITSALSPRVERIYLHDSCM